MRNITVTPYIPKSGMFMTCFSLAATGHQVLTSKESVAEKFGVQIIEQETDLDHIHILFTSRPRYSSQSL